MNKPEESQPTPDYDEPSQPVAPDVADRLSKIESDVAKILGIIEPPHLAEVARKAEEAEAARKMEEGYASGDMEYRGYPTR